MKNISTISTHKKTELEKLITFLDLLEYYSELIADLERQTAPLELHDRKQRRQRVTLLARPDSLYVLILIYFHSTTKLNGRRAYADRCMRELGERITPANISRVLWKHSNLRELTIEPTRAQRVQAGRVVEASLQFKLTEPAPSANRKEKPIEASQLLINLIEQLADYSKLIFGRSEVFQDSNHPLSEFINQNSS